ncbi:hypothetical protein KSF78_0006946 [Schistosoma japonicum]|nr:hypothetical protein KSF78_0006946 [Schistosoma japonicum]
MLKSLLHHFLLAVVKIMILTL